MMVFKIDTIIMIFQILCFDSKNWIGNGLLIPSGPMRETIESLKKYDAVIIKNIDKKFESKKIHKIYKKINPKIRIFNSFFKIKIKDEFNLNDKFLIFSGIGNSNSFIEILIKNNFNIIKEIVFPDHFNYKKHDILNLIKVVK